MSSWRSFHLHSSELDRLILACVHPVIEDHRERLSLAFWERHYAGGPHLRVRLRGDSPDLDAAARDLVTRARRFLAEHPSADLEDYSEERAAALLERDGVPPALEDLRYRNNAVLERPYRRRELFTGAPDALELAEDFRHETEPLAVEILRGPRPKLEAVLRLYFVKALFRSKGDIRQGSVAWKSHWEGFAAGFPSTQVLDRIVQAYEGNRTRIHALMDDVLDLHRRGALREDPVLHRWHRVLETFDRRTRRLLAEGRQLLRQPASPAEARELRERVLRGFERDSSFVRTFWADERFVASIGREPRFQVPRLLTNLLYLLVPAVGLTPLEKMTLCYFAHRPVEERFGCDLEALLASSISRAIERHETAGAAPVTDPGIDGTLRRERIIEGTEDG